MGITNFSLGYIQLTGEPRSNAKHLNLRVYEAFSTYLKNKNLQELQTALFPMEDFLEHARLLNETLCLDIAVQGENQLYPGFCTGIPCKISQDLVEHFEWLLRIGFDEQADIVVIEVAILKLEMIKSKHNKPNYEFLVLLY